MSTGQRSTWPVVLLLGLCVSLLLGSAVAAAGEDDDDGGLGAGTVTGHVIVVEGGTVVLDEVQTYEEVQHVGTLTVEVPAGTEVHLDDLVDVELERRDGRWHADELTVLDPD